MGMVIRHGPREAWAPLLVLAPQAHFLLLMSLHDQPVPCQQFMRENGGEDDPERDGEQQSCKHEQLGRTLRFFRQSFLWHSNAFQVGLAHLA